jgi:Secretion system C-terminal sorting domain
MKKLYAILSVFVVAVSTSLVALAAAPTVASSGLNFTNVLGDRMTVNWTSGNGATRLVVARQGSAVTFAATNGTSYAAYQSLGAGEVLIYVGSGNTTNFTTMGSTNLPLGTTYYFKIIELNGTGTGTQYLNAPALTGSQATLPASSEPTIAISSPYVSSKFEEPYQLSTRQKMGINWSSGNGATTMIIARAGSPVDPSVIPTDGTKSYQWQGLANGHFVCYYGTGNFMQFKSEINTKLSPNTTYHFLFVTLNGNGPTSNYLASTYATLAATTLADAPTTASSGLNFTNIQTNQMTLNWTNGNGSNRIIIAKQGSAPSFSPVNGTPYPVNISVASGEYVVYNGSSSTYTLNGSTSLGTLSPSTSYYFAIYDYTGSSSSCSYITPALSGNQATSGLTAEPTAAASGLVFSNVTTNSMTLTWTNGNGANRILLGRKSSAVVSTPADGSTYTANQGLNNDVVLYIGSSNTFNLNNGTGFGTITSASTYYFSVYEYNGTGSSTNYLTSSFLSGNQATLTPPTEPTVPSSGLSFTNIQAHRMTLNWTSGNGSGRIVLLNQGSAVTGVPSDGSAQPAYSGVGPNVVVYNGAGSSATVTNDGNVILVSGATYHFAIYEYNGTGSGTNYLTSSFLTGSQTTLAGGRLGTDSEGNIAYALYPNPVADVLHLAVPASEASNRKVSLINAQGMSVYTRDLSDGQADDLQLETSSYPKGMYYLTITSDRQVIIQEKIIVY